MLMGAADREADDESVGSSLAAMSTEDVRCRTAAWVGELGAIHSAALSGSVNVRRRTAAITEKPLSERNAMCTSGVWGVVMRKVGKEGGRGCRGVERREAEGTCTFYL